MITVQYAKVEPGITFNAVEPGYTATELTAGIGGGRPVEESAAVVARMAAIGPDGPTGRLWEVSGELPW
jgi:NAD(P)-dependent dehydrogenase (short-subunit alcohol dehydrogenase family)